MFRKKEKTAGEKQPLAQIPTQQQKKHAKQLRRQKKKSNAANASAAKNIAKRRAPKTAADCIGFDLMYEDGLCEVQPGLYSLMIEFGDINYQQAQEEDQVGIFTRYCELLNAISPEIHFQVCLLTRRLDLEDFAAQVYLPKSDRYHPALEPYRKEIDQIIYDQAVKGQNGLVRNKYIVLSTAAESPDEARRLLAPVEGRVQAKLRELKSTSDLLAGLQRLQVLHDLLRPDARMAFDYSWLVAEQQLRAKDFICPSGFDFRPTHEDSDAAYNDRYRFGGKVGKVVYLRDIASDMTDDLLARLSKLDFNLALSLHVDAIPQYSAIEMIKTKLAYMNQEASDEMRKAAKDGLPPGIGVRFELSRQIKEAEALLDKLQNRNQKLFRATLLVQTYADTNEQLDEQVKQICATAQEKTCRFDTLEFQQQAAMNSVLPLGVKQIALERTLTTANTAIFLPFTTRELYQPGGCYEGINSQSKNLILCNRKQLAVGNGLIAGIPGSGKSLLTKLQEIQILINWPEDDVIVLDPDGEYGPLGAAFGGEIFTVSAGSGDYLNPLEINQNYNDGKDPLIVKSQFLMAFCDVVSDGGITAAERTLIDKAAKAAYAPYFSHPGEKRMPTLIDFYDMLRRLGPPAERLVQMLGIYVDGTLDLFAHPSTVDTDSRFVIYNLQGIGKQLMTPGMMVVLDQISNRMTRNRALGKRTWIFVDEIQLLFLNDYCSEYFFSWSGIVRKYGAILTSITQHVETLLMTDNGRRMLGDCQYVKLLNQHANDRRHLGELYNLSAEELATVSNAKTGCGLLIAGSAVVPFDGTIPKDTQLYRLINTDPGKKEGEHA